MIFRMVTKSLKYNLLLLFMLVASVVGAQDFPAMQTPPRMVNDFANVIPDREEAFIEQKLRAFNDTTSTQIAVVTVTDLDGMDISQYATELAHKWGIGGKGKDNGALVLVKPQGAGSKGSVFIAVGYGLEGVIPDAIASQIVRDVMIPEFKAGNMSKGINEATDVMMALSSGEYSADAMPVRRSKKEGSNVIFVLMIAGIGLLLGIFGRRGGSRTVSSNNVGSNLPLMILFSLLSGGRGGGGGFGGGSGGSDFGGFGGGGFGGGGAGGDW